MTVKFNDCKRKHLVEESEFDQTCTISGGTVKERIDCKTHLKLLLESIIVKKVDNPPSDLEERIPVIAKYFLVTVLFIDNVVWFVIGVEDPQAQMNQANLMENQEKGYCYD